METRQIKIALPVEVVAKLQALAERRHATPRDVVRDLIVAAHDGNPIQPTPVAVPRQRATPTPRSPKAKPTWGDPRHRDDLVRTWMRRPFYMSRSDAERTYDEKLRAHEAALAVREVEGDLSIPPYHSAEHERYGPEHIEHLVNMLRAGELDDNRPQVIIPGEPVRRDFRLPIPSTRENARRYVEEVWVKLDRGEKPWLFPEEQEALLR